MIDIDNYFGTVSEEDYVQQTEEHFKYLESLLEQEEDHTSNETMNEIQVQYAKCNELFDIAWELNQNENTRTAFTQKVTTYMPDVMQTLLYLMGEGE